jgi:NSS family neurotransmitter:Na+ symporter
MLPSPERWSGRVGFILATIGSAVGLGSIWKFPYEVGANGGGAFVILYLAGLALIVLPLLLAEFAIGRRGQLDAPGGIRAVALSVGASGHWSLIGALGVVTAALILSFYSVIGGWALEYAVETLSRGLPPPDSAAVQARFNSMLASPGRMMLFHTIFMAGTVVIVAGGVARGIERASKLLMPVLIGLMVLLAIYSVMSGGLSATLRFLIFVDTSRLTAKVALEALGLGFFSIGVGLAIMVTYAAFAGQEINLKQVSIVTIVGDTVISFLAGFAIFPIVFANQLDPAAGPGLLFITLPLAFARLPFGTVAAAAFFVLLVIAALASAISMLEMAAAWFRRVARWSQPRSAVAAGALCWLAGIASVLSFNLWAGWYPMSFVPSFATASVFDLLDHLTSNIMLPVGGFALSVFAGWILPAGLLVDELSLHPKTVALLRMLLRYIVPCGIAAVTFGHLG